MALDKFQPYLFVSAGEQSNKFLTPAYSGGIASFQAQRAQDLKGLTVQFGPIQEGTGDPSPENVRPISGRTGLTVTRAGKNLLPNIKYQSGINNVYLGTNSANYELYLPVGTYTLSVEYLNNVHSAVFYRFASDSANRNIWTTASTDSTGTFTVDKDEPFKLGLYNSNGISADNIGNFQIEAGSTATAYEPYVGQTYPITWQTEAGTVYGGTLDVVSGVLTMTHSIVDMGTLSWGRATSYAHPVFYTSQNNKGTKAEGTVSSMFHTLVGGATNAYDFSRQSSDFDIASSTTNTQIFVRYDAISDIAAFTAAVTGQALVYPLATPQTYQLDPEDVKTLAGFNQIYSDAGPVIDIQF